VTTSPSRVGATASAAVVVVAAIVAGAGGVLLAEPVADDPLLDGPSLGVRVPVGLLPLPGAVLPVHGAHCPGEGGAEPSVWFVLCDGARETTDQRSGEGGAYIHV
jgi:hypothetical protein